MLRVANGYVAAAHRRQELVGRLRFLDRIVPGRTEAVPRRVDTREVEVALRGEVPVEDRLAHARLARDLGGCGPAIRALREDAEGRIDQRATALRRGQPRGDRHPATGSGS